MYFDVSANSGWLSLAKLGFADLDNAEPSDWLSHAGPGEWYKSKWKEEIQVNKSSWNLQKHSGEGRTTILQVLDEENNKNNERTIHQKLCCRLFRSKA
jgi:hypothetical protein